MMQRVFDKDNEKDMADLWDILPDEVSEISQGVFSSTCLFVGNTYFGSIPAEIIKINWHDETKIYRPIKEATKEDIGKICAFWENGWGYFVYAELAEILPERKSVYRYIAGHEKNGYEHCRRLTKQEIEELC